MSLENSTPKTIWIITEETEAATTTFTGERGSRDGRDIGGRIGAAITQVTEVVVSKQKEIEVAVLKQKMQGFLQAIREILDEADQPDSRIELDEVQLSVEINREGQISLLGTSAKAGDKGAITFKFKRK